MVGFCESEYTFPFFQTLSWEKLISHYYGQDCWENRTYHPYINEITIKTGRIWEGTISSQVIPSVKTHPLPSKNDSENEVDSEVIDSVDKFIRRKLNLGFIQVGILPVKFKKNCEPFDVLCQIKERDNITNWFYSPSENEVFLLLNGFEPVVISSGLCFICEMPELDFDDGFYDGKVYPEWKEDFDNWKEKADFWMGKHILDEIVQVRKKDNKVK